MSGANNSAPTTSPPASVKAASVQAASVKAASVQGLDRSLFIVDNLHLLRAIDNETVDLIVTDPPFGKRDTFIGKLRPSLTMDELEAEKQQLSDWGIRSRSQAEANDIEWPPNGEEAQYEDIWTWEGDVHEEWFETLRDQHPAAHAVVAAARYIHEAPAGQKATSLAAYLTFMAVRLVEMHRVLKPTGSLYLHCDHTANSYLRLLLDAIFGAEQLRNEIIWRIGWVSGFKTQKRGWIRNHDTILYYLKSNAAAERFNKEYIPYPDGYTRRDGSAPSGKGIPIEDTWNCHDGDVLDSIMIKSFSREKTGYPTQKPVALAERIIAASSNPEDLVFDPFAGCAYVPVAAELLGRKWVACDISPRAMTVIRRQFGKKWEQRLDMRDAAVRAPLDFSRVTVLGPNDLPERTTTDPHLTLPPPLDDDITFKRPSPVMPEREQKRVLARLSRYACWACGFSVRGADGEVIEDDAYFELDHVLPQSAGGSHGIHNKSLLCRQCNGTKGSRQITVAQLRELPKVAERRDTLGVAAVDLVDHVAVTDAAIEEYVHWRAL